jgi:hypothetical protein
MNHASSQAPATSDAPAQDGSGVDRCDTEPSCSIEFCGEFFVTDEVIDLARSNLWR